MNHTKRLSWSHNRLNQHEENPAEIWAAPSAVLQEAVVNIAKRPNWNRVASSYIRNMWITGGWHPSGKGLQLQVPQVSHQKDLTWTHHINIIIKTEALLPLQTQEAQHGERNHLNSAERICHPWRSSELQEQVQMDQNRWTIRLFQLLPSGPQGPAQQEALTTTLRNSFFQQQKNRVTLADLFTYTVFAHPLIGSVLRGKLSDDGCYDVLAL